MEREPALEAQEQVLSVGVDARDRAAGEPLRPAVERVTRMGGPDLVRDVTLEHRPDAVGRVGDRVALRH